MTSIPPALTSALDALVEWAPDGESVTLILNGTTDIDLPRNLAVDLAEAWTDVATRQAGTVRAVGNFTIRKVNHDRATLAYTTMNNAVLVRTSSPYGRALLDQLTRTIPTGEDAA